MQLQDLDIFCQLYQLRSINAAAKALGYAQSNLTARLQLLETEFDAHFFTRSYQGIEPTPQGTQFYQYAQQTLQATNEIRQQLHRPHGKQQVIISELLFNALVVHQHQYDLAHFDFDIQSSTAIETLTKPRVDLVITYAHFDQPNYQRINQQQLPASFLVAAGVSDTQSLPYLVNSDLNCPFRARTLTFLKQDLTRVQEIDSWESIINLVRAGAGIALLPSYIGRHATLTNAHPAKRFKITYATYQPTAPHSAKG